MCTATKGRGANLHHTALLTLFWPGLLQAVAKEVERAAAQMLQQLQWQQLSQDNPLPMTLPLLGSQP